MGERQELSLAAIEQCIANLESQVSARMMAIDKLSAALASAHAIHVSMESALEGLYVERQKLFCGSS